jgi:hypothetical protein
MKSLVVICALASAVVCSAQTPATITAHPESQGIAIPRDFIGLSFETGSLTSTPAFPGANVVFQRMVTQLGPGVLRFGGNTVDQLTGWMRGQRTSSTSASIITSSDADQAFAFARAAGWRVLWSLNLGHGDPATDADEAAYVYQSASDVLIGLEIGNEPNLYHSNGLRPSTYTLGDYISEWQTYGDAIQSKVPSAVLTGAAASGGGLATWTTPFAQQLGSRIALLTQHLYPLTPAETNPNASNAATIANILGDATRTTEDADGSQLQAQRIPWRMAETNSCNNSGQQGVSDVFASALWGVDYMFTLAGHNSGGVNFHCGSGGNYLPTPIQAEGNQIIAHPLYYALLLFRAAAQGRMVPLDVAANGVNLTAYGVVDNDDTLRVTVINKDLAQNAAVTLTAGSGYTRASVMRLAAPAVDSTTGVTLGGATVAVDGSWSPAQLENGTVNGGAFHTTVSAGSAALVTLSNSGARRGRCRGECASRMMSSAER